MFEFWDPGEIFWSELELFQLSLSFWTHMDTASDKQNQEASCKERAQWKFSEINRVCRLGQGYKHAGSMTKIKAIWVSQSAY